MFCDRCGIQFLGPQATCSHCGASPTRHWLQLVSLVTLAIALACNSLVALFLLPRLVVREEASFLYRGWHWFDERLSLYGWLAAAVALLVWLYWPRFAYEAEREVKVARALLILLVLGALAVLVLPLLPGELLGGVRDSLAEQPVAAVSLAWGVVVLAVGILCLNPETRDRLWGDGRVLSLVSLGVLVLVLALMLVGWRAV